MSLKHIAAQAKQQLDGTGTGKISWRALSAEEMDGKGFAKLMKDSKIVGTRFTTTDGLQKLNGIGSFWLVCVSVQITGG